MFGYSKTTNAFYMMESKENYIAAGTWQDDIVEVEDSIAVEFMQSPPEGKMRIAASDGMPDWADIPPPTTEELIASAIEKKRVLIAEASAIIAPLVDAKAGGYIDEEDIPRLALWQKYRYALTKVATEKPNWPEVPC